MTQPISFQKCDIQSWGASLAQEQYHNTRKVQIATDAFGIGTEFLTSNSERYTFCPFAQEGYMCGGSLTKEQYEQIKEDLHHHIMEQMQPQHYYGFVITVSLLGWLFLTVMGGIVGWVVSKLMDLYFPHPFGPNS